jgi:starch phosphorylase
MFFSDERVALAVPEMMRVLLDEQGLGWDEAWSRTRAATVSRLGSPKS